MPIRAPRRQTLLFLLVLLVPCLLLIALGVRMIAEGDDMAATRQMDADRRHREQVGDELLARLERTKLEQAGIQAAVTPAGSIAKPVDPDVALVGRVRSGRLQLPWDASPAQARFAAMLAGSRFAQVIAEGERQEASLQFEAAARTFERAVSLASDRVAADYANLLHGRALVKCRCTAEAEPLLVALLDSPVVDDQGVPLAFYAAKVLLPLGGHELRVLEMLAATPTDSHTAPTAAYFAADLLRTLADTASSPEDRERVAGLLNVQAPRIQDLERALRLQADWPVLESGILARSEPVWLPYDDGAWLVGAAPSLAGQPPLVIAFRAPAVLATFAAAAPGTGALAFATGGGSGDPVGAAFPGLRVSTAAPGADSVLAGWNSQRTYYIVAILAVMGVVLAGGAMFWWEVRRELRTAELRAQFVASVSHELRTPLTAIRMYGETLLDRPLGDIERREYLETIVDESERLTRLVNNVLDSSRIERGEKVYHPAPASLPAIVRDAAHTMRSPLARGGFELSVDVDDAMPAVSVDRDAIGQAVLNLLGNAMKYSGDARAIALTVARENGDAVVAVRDRGIGIAEADRVRIFERFYRVESPVNDRIPGTGLGLALVDHIARAHGGRVEVTSVPGAGSTFALHIPFATPAAQEAGS